MHALDLKGLFGNFLQIHYTRLMAQIVRVCNSHNLEIGDVVCELDLMPDKYGVIPAMQDPPAFKTVPYWSYVNGSRLREKGWFTNHWTPSSQEELKKAAMKLMLREFGKPLTGTKFILHYANTVVVVSNVPGVADKEALEAFRGESYGQEGIRVALELHWNGALSKDDLRVFIPAEVLWGLERAPTV